MTQDDMMTNKPNVPYVINKAYQALRDNGVKADLEWMQQLRMITETQLGNIPNIDRVRDIFDLEIERATCLRTVTQLQEQVHTLQRVNRRYGEKIFDTDKAINEVMPKIEWVQKELDDLYFNYPLEQIHNILDAALCDFPKELVKE